MKKREYDRFIFIRTNQKKVSLSHARTSPFYFIDWNFCKMLTAWNQCSTVKKTFRNWVLDEPHSSLTNRESLESETEGGTNKRSKDRSSLWLQEESLTMKAFLPTVRRLSHCNVNTQSQQPSRRVGIAAPQSLVQNEVSTQSTARRVWDRAETDKKSMCVYFGKSASSCLWGKDREKTAWLQFPGQDRKTAAWGRREDREREGEVWGLVWSTLNVFPEQFERTPPPSRRKDGGKKCGRAHTHRDPAFADYQFISTEFSFAAQLLFRHFIEILHSCLDNKVVNVRL